jgi:hypothetical protein
MIEAKDLTKRYGAMLLRADIPASINMITSI